MAQATGISRRSADTAIKQGRVRLNNITASVGDMVSAGDSVTFDGHTLQIALKTSIMLNKPPGYVSSRIGQGSKTIYQLLPKQHHDLKPVGRLDKDSSGLLILTNDGDLANQLTHPSYSKTKTYEIELNKPLTQAHQQLITAQGVELEDGISQLKLKQLNSNQTWLVIMSEGRNRQIRRTFEALGYKVTKLHRISMGAFSLGSLPSGKFMPVK